MYADFTHKHINYIRIHWGQMTWTVDPGGGAMTGGPMTGHRPTWTSGTVLETTPRSDQTLPNKQHSGRGRTKNTWKGHLKKEM